MRGAMPMMQTIARRAAIAVLALALAGCVSLGGGKPPEALIALTADERAPAGPMASGTANNAIVVLDPEADRRFDVDRVAVQVTPSNVAYLKDAIWVEKPARQFRRLLAETVRARASRVVVEGGDYEVTGSTMVSGRLLQMGYDASAQAVVVRFDAMVEEKGGAVRSRRFEAEVPGVAASAAAVGPALNRAANEVAKEAAGWILGG
jgi:cholesterol transport system auxiliary component